MPESAGFPAFPIFDFLVIDGVHNQFDFCWKEQWNKAETMKEEHNHPIWENYVPDTDAGHDGMDYLVLSTFFDSVKRQAPTPIDVMIRRYGRVFLYYRNNPSRWAVNQ